MFRQFWGSLVATLISVSTAVGAERASPLLPEEATIKFAPVIAVTDIFFQGQARGVQEQGGGFDPVIGRLGFKSRFSSSVDIELGVGSSSLLNPPRWSQSWPGSVSLLDVKATLHQPFGDIYVGQFQIPFGLEGSQKEDQLWLPRSFLYEKGYLPFYDLGAGYHVDWDGFYVNLTAHNGDGPGQSNSDGRVFTTGQWGYRGAANTNMGFSLTSGRLAMPIATVETKVRAANAFFGFNIFGLGLQIEGTYLQTITDSTQLGSTTTDALAWHGDIEHPITDSVNLIARYEELNPNVKGSAVVLSRIYAGGEYHSRNQSSRLFLFFVKNEESKGAFNNDEIRVVWRVSPPLTD